MFKLIRFIIGVVILALAAYVVFFVPVGRHTMWGHLSAIWSTEEAQDMRDGISSKVGEVSKEVSAKSDEKVPEKRDDKIPDHITDKDRKDLDKLIKARTGGQGSSDD